VADPARGTAIRRTVRNTEKKLREPTDASATFARWRRPLVQIATAPSGPSHVRSDPVYVVKARLFRTLGHPVRIRILELLLDRERGVGELQSELKLDSSGTSQHLSALRQLGLLESRRAGTSVFYRVKDPRVAELLAVARLILTSTLSDSRALLSDLTGETHEAQS